MIKNNLSQTMEFYTFQLVSRLGEIIFELDSNSTSKSPTNNTFQPEISVEQRMRRVKNERQLQLLILDDWPDVSRKINESLQHYAEVTGLNAKPEWDFWNAMFLAITTYTTIGMTGFIIF